MITYELGLTSSEADSLVIWTLIGGVIFGHLSDHFPRWIIFVIYQIGAVVMVIYSMRLSDPPLMLFAGALIDVFVNGMIGG